MSPSRVTHFDDPDADRRRHGVGGPPLPGRQTGRDPEQRDDLLDAERPGRQGQQDGGVDAARERHTQPIDPGQQASQIGRGPLDQLVVALLRHPTSLLVHRARLLRRWLPIVNP